MLDMRRWKLITKEKAKEAYEGKLKNDGEWKGYCRPSPLTVILGILPDATAIKTLSLHTINHSPH